MKLESVPNTNKRGDSLWRVLEDVRIKVAPRMYVQVPAGYVSNLGSVPRIARAFVAPSEGGLAELFLLHDWMCSEDQEDDGVDIDSGYSRWMSDSVLYELMVRKNIAPHKRYIIWLALRIYARARGLK